MMMTMVSTLYQHKRQQQQGHGVLQGVRQQQGQGQGVQQGMHRRQQQQGRGVPHDVLHAVQQQRQQGQGQGIQQGMQQRQQQGRGIRQGVQQRVLPSSLRCSSPVGGQGSYSKRDPGV